MAKGIARLGILLSLLLINAGVGAVALGEPLFSETRSAWFELDKPGAEAINLRDIVIGDDGGDNRQTETDLLILPGYFRTLARHRDRRLNDGIGTDYVYDIFSLSDAGDEIVSRAGSQRQLRFEYGSGFDVTHRGVIPAPRCAGVSS